MEGSEERDRRGKHDAVGEERAPDAAGTGQDDERNRELLFLRVEARRDEAPDLKHDEGRREHDAADECDVEIKRETFTGPGEDERLAARQGFERGRKNEIAYAIDEEEGDQHAGADGDTGVDQARSEFVEML